MYYYYRPQGCCNGVGVAHVTPLASGDAVCTQAGTGFDTNVAGGGIASGVFRVSTQRHRRRGSIPESAESAQSGQFKFKFQADANSESGPGYHCRCRITRYQYRPIVPLAGFAITLCQ